MLTSIEDFTAKVIKYRPLVFLYYKLSVAQMKDDFNYPQQVSLVLRDRCSTKQEALTITQQDLKGRELQTISNDLHTFITSVLLSLYCTFPLKEKS